MDLPEIAPGQLDGVPSPALLVWPERVEANIARMIDLVGGDCSRLRPHVKTHKMEAVVRLQLEAGIAKFKAATIAEVEMCLMAGAQDVLFAYPAVGPSVKRLIELARRFPEARLSIIAEDSSLLDGFAAADDPGIEFGVFVDFDCGMHRTGTSSSREAIALATRVEELDHLSFKGIHAYDGHVRAQVESEREEVWSQAMASVSGLQEELEKHGIAVESVVGGGSPTFGFHAAKRGWECSPGTTLFWDGGYGSQFPDLPFQPAAFVLTRIISKPGANKICLDLGHKAIASEGPLEKRLTLIGLENAKPIGHSEEHLVLEVEGADSFGLGDVFLALPHHICPTVALHQEAVLVRNGEPTGEAWPVTARNRRIIV